MFNMTKGTMRGFTLILSVIVIFSLLSALLNAAPVPDEDDTSIQTFELDRAAPNLISPVTVTDMDAGILPNPNSSPQVWNLQAVGHHRAHPGSESPGRHNDTHSYHPHHQLGRRHSYALNCQDDRTYTTACTRKGYSCSSLGRVITRGHDSWCDTKCRCVNLSPKSCLNQLAIYVHCYFKGENIMGADGTVIGNIYTAEDVGNDTLVLH
ncbi:hypothetical protein RBB50_003910 [Rhinocladiella similis]